MTRPFKIETDRRASILADPMGRLEGAADDMRRLAAAADAAEGHRDVLGLLQERVATFADVLWVITCEAPRGALHGADISGALYVIPVLLLAMEAGAEHTALVEGECVADCLKATPAWDWCSSLARDLAKEILGELEGVAQPEEVAHAP